MQPYLTRSKNLVMIGFVAPDRGQTNRHTDRQTRSSQYSATRTGRGVIISVQTGFTFTP